MVEKKKNKSLPYLLGIPNLGVGLLWAMNMTLIPMLVATVTNSNQKAGLLISMGAFTGMFVQILSGALSDRSNFKMGKRKPFILIGSLFTTLFMCIMPFSRSYGLMFFTAFMFYFSLNFYQGPYYSLIPDSVDDDQLGLANGFARVISVIGGGFIFITGTALWNSKSSVNINHSLPFFVGASLGLITMLITFFLIKEDNSKYTKPPKFSFDFIKFKSPMKLFIAVFFIYLTNGSITPFFVKYCTNGLHLTDNVASLSLLLLTLVGALFAYPIGILSDRIERRKVLLLGTLIFGVALLVGAFVKTAIGLYVIMSVIGIGFIAIQVTSYSILAEVVPQHRIGEFMGIFNFFVSASQFVANNIMGMVLDKFGYKMFFIIPTITMFIAMIIISLSKFEKYDNLKNSSSQSV